MISIRKNELVQVVKISKKIPEFNDPYALEEYKSRISGESHLVLTAKENKKTVGFKIGYDRFHDGSFYSWRGGVLPEYRQRGVATSLAEIQEKWAEEMSYNKIKMITWKKHKAMIRFSLHRGFKITGGTSKNPASESRVWMEKSL